MAIDLSGLSRKELEKLQADVEKALRKISKTELKEAKRAAEEAAAKYGFSLADLAGKSGKTAALSASPAKYSNPDDPTQTWTGRGRQPQWYKNAIDGGKTPEDMEV